MWGLWMREWLPSPQGNFYTCHERPRKRTMETCNTTNDRSSERHATRETGSMQTSGRHAAMILPTCSHYLGSLAEMRPLEEGRRFRFRSHDKCLVCNNRTCRDGNEERKVAVKAQGFYMNVGNPKCAKLMAKRGANGRRKAMIRGHTLCVSRFRRFFLEGSHRTAADTGDSVSSSSQKVHAERM